MYILLAVVLAHRPLALLPFLEIPAAGAPARFLTRPSALLALCPFLVFALSLLFLPTFDLARVQASKAVVTRL